MYKLVVFTTLLAVATAAPGLIGASYGAPLASYGAPIASYAAPIAAAPWGHGIVSSPLISTGVVKTAVPVATSYANTVRIASPAVVAAPAYAAHAPLVAAHGW